MLIDELLTYISERAGVARVAINPDTPLFSDGLLDSLATIELTAFVEKKSGVRFKAADINLDNLDSLNRIMAFVNARRAVNRGR